MERHVLEFLLDPDGHAKPPSRAQLPPFPGRGGPWCARPRRWHPSQGSQPPEPSIPLAMAVLAEPGKHERHTTVASLLRPQPFAGAVEHGGPPPASTRPLALPIASREPAMAGTCADHGTDPCGPGIPGLSHGRGEARRGHPCCRRPP